VTRDLSSLLTKVGRIAVSSSPEGAEVSVDDLVLGATPLAEDWAVDPGAHKLDLRLAGYVPASESVEVIAGERNSVRVNLVPTATTASPIVTPLQSSQSPKANPAMVAVRESSQATVPWGWWIAAGATAGLGAGFSFLALGNGASLRDAKASLDPATQDLERYAGRTKAFALTADVLWTSALVLAGVGVYFTFFHRGAKGSAEKSANSMVFTW
jgi:hypothetical protein